MNIQSSFFRQSDLLLVQMRIENVLFHFDLKSLTWKTTEIESEEQ